IYPPIEDSKPASEKDADMQQIKAEDQPGAAKEINPIKQQIMEENLPGAAPKFDAERYQSMSDNQPGSLPQQNRVGRSIAGGGASSW
ncbi:MAG: hypothetical protein KA794_10570, partial [Candidatus Obscuribacter sp.]|nr:hypothetical protein [Candidatus Obscuribacter sp.]